MKAKSFLKSVARTLAMICVLPALGLFYLQAAIAGRSTAFPGWSQGFSLLPGTMGVYLRHAFYCMVLPGCGRDACVSFGTIFSHADAQIGRTVYIGNFCSIGNVTIEDDVLIASHVSILNGCRQHHTTRLDVPVREQAGEYAPVAIGRDTWIGERATVAASVGRHCVIGAGALVLQPLPDYAIAVGVPAKIIGDRRDTVDDSAAATAAGVNTDISEPKSAKVV